MSRLDHPNIVKFLGWIDDPNYGWFIAMEFVEGEDFDHMLSRMGTVPPAKAIDMMLPALDALAYAHASGVIHRDIKPANLMLLSSGIVKVLDFGTAKLVDQGGMTRVGQQIGTSVYMPLEQLMGRPISVQADIYAMGVTLYELVTGKLPFYHDNPIELAKILMSNDPVPPSQIFPAAPKALDAVILKALAREPQNRFAHAIEFKDALAAVRATLDGRGAPAVAAAAAPAEKAPSGPARAAYKAPSLVDVPPFVPLAGAIAGFAGVIAGAGAISAGSSAGWVLVGLFGTAWLATSILGYLRAKR
jgi:serine/threonine-protein kinase